MRVLLEKKINEILFVVDNFVFISYVMRTIFHLTIKLFFDRIILH